MNIYNSHFVFPMVNEFSYQFGYFVINLERALDFERTEKLCQYVYTVQRLLSIEPVQIDSLVKMIQNQSTFFIYTISKNGWQLPQLQLCNVHNSNDSFTIDMVHFHFGVVCIRSEFNFMANVTRLRKYTSFQRIVNVIV